MERLFPDWLRVCAPLVAIVLSWAAAAGCLMPAGEDPAAAAPRTQAPRTPWGDPDLQGIWVGSTLTPLERPAEFEGREFLTYAEVARLEDGALLRQARLAQRPSERATAGGSVDWRADGTPGFYNDFWLDGSWRWLRSRRTSLVVDPPAGRIPYTADARQGERPHGSGPWHSFLDLDTGERCLGDGLPQVWFGYNPNHQIFQNRTHVVIVHEMFSQRRIIPLDGGPPTNIPRWNGEPRGRWDGDTLVVESRTFVDRPDARWASTWRHPTGSLHLVERFTRVDAETIDYEATITDPARFARPWTIQLALSADQSGRGVAAGGLFEFACHEGNYAMTNVLRGARAQEHEEALAAAAALAAAGP